MAKNEERYVARIKTGLQEAYARSPDPETLDLENTRLIVLSDLHRGARNGADDFAKCERAYNAALAYYFQMGYTLVALGDMEELWEERARKVLFEYGPSLELEAQFHKRGRYNRVWGNHDDEWMSPNAVDRHLGPRFGSDPQGRSLRVNESLRFRVVEDRRELGELFLVHGHQGTTWSDRHRRWGRIVVRWVWRPIQRLTGWSFNTPATSWELGQAHNLAMHQWAVERDRLVLVAGHTHRPVFQSRPHVADIKRELSTKKAKLGKQPGDPTLTKEVAELLAEIEWVQGQYQRRTGKEKTLDAARPAYFNTGCCCYLDGDITGLEINEGKIVLVRWPDDHARPKPQYLTDKVRLSEVFGKCGKLESGAAESPTAEPVADEEPVLVG